MDIKRLFKLGATPEGAIFSCSLTAILFALIHVGYLLFFLAAGATFMVWYNAAIIILYLASLYLCFKYTKAFIFLAYYEVQLFVALSIIFVGWNYGFQILSIGMVMLVFYSAYMAKKIENFNLNPIGMGVFGMVLFVALAIWSSLKDPLVKVTIDNVELYQKVMTVTHGVMVFMFDIFFGFLLMKAALKLEEQILNNSMIDYLTKLNNRKGIENKYDSISNDSLCNYIVSIYDIDNFKKLNDTYGHLYGDKVLIEVSRMLREELSDEFVSRWGGEEFVSIVKIDNSIENAYCKIDNVRKLISQYPFTFKNKNVKVTVTVGTKSFDSYESLEDWVNAADKNLYKGKSSGKNIHIY